MLKMQNKNLWNLYLECIILDPENPKKYCSLHWNLDSTYDYNNKFNITITYSAAIENKIYYFVLPFVTTTITCLQSITSFYTIASPNGYSCCGFTISFYFITTLW